MAHFFGNIDCPNCQLETRFLTDSEQEELCLLGDRYQGKSIIQESVACDYCQSDINLYIVTKNDVISAFLNEEQYQKYQHNEWIVEEAKTKIGYEMEKKKQLKQFHETETFPFKKQPFRLHQTVKIAEQKWKIESVFKKESVEKELSKRVLSPFLNEYLYEVTNIKTNEKKWLIVTDVKKDNAVLTPDYPVVKENEQLFDVSETLAKDELLYEKQSGENFIVRAYQQLAGVRLTVSTVSEESEEQLEADIFDETLELALEKLEELFAETI